MLETMQVWVKAGVKEAWFVDPVVISYNQWLNRRNGKRVRAFNVLSNFWPSGRLRARSRDGDLQDNDFREARKRAVRDGPSRLLPDFVMDFQMIWKLAMQDSTRSTSNRWAAAPLPLSSWNPERGTSSTLRVGSIFGVPYGICLTYSYKVPLLYLCVSMFGLWYHKHNHRLRVRRSGWIYFYKPPVPLPDGGPRAPQCPHIPIRPAAIPSLEATALQGRPCALAGVECSRSYLIQQSVP